MSNEVDYKILKKLALSRLKEAKILLKYGYSHGAYYLAGYSIELSLKSYYCKQMLFPPRETKDLYTHNLETLLQSCGLKGHFEKSSNENKKLKVAWGVVKDWTEEARYKIHNPKDAKDFLNVVNTIFLWIKKRI